MKKYLIALVLVLFATAAAAGVWTWRRSQSPLDKARALMAAGDLTDAQLTLRNAVLNDPSNAEAHFRLGTIQLQFGDPIAAEKELKEARNKGYNTQEIAPRLARAYLMQGKYQDVLTEFPVAIQPSAEAVPILISRGLAEFGLKQYDNAEAAITQAENLDPHSLDALLAAAQLALVRGDAVSAERKVDQALQIDGHSIEALRQKAALLDRRGEHAQALATYDAAIALAPRAIPLRINRANALIAAGENAKAKQDVDFVRKADPKNRLAIFQQAVLSVRGQEWSKADIDLQQLSLVLPQLPRGEYFFAMVKLHLNQLEQATEAATRYVARAPKDLDGYKLLASIDLAAHRPGPAVDVLKNAVATGNADTGTLQLLSQSYSQNGQSDLALQTLVQAKTLTPNNPAVLTQLATQKLQRGDAASAAEDLQHSLTLTSTSASNATTAAALIVAALEAGNIPQALAGLDSLRQQKVNPAVIAALTGTVKMAQLDFDGAKASFEEALRVDPDTLPARLNLCKILILQGHPMDAERLLEDALEKQPASATTLDMLIPILLSQHKNDQAIAALTAARAAAPTNLSITVALANLHIQLGSPLKALELLGQTAGDQVSVLVTRARAQMTLGQRKDAQNTYQQIVAKQPSDPEARRQLAILLMAENDPAAAKVALIEGLASIPGNQLLLEALVAITAKTDGLESGLALAAQLEKVPANLPAAYTLAGGLQMSVKNYEAAATAFESELKKAPSSLLVRDTAMALKLAGKLEKAVSLLQNWQISNPQDLDCTSMLAILQIEGGNLGAAETNLEKILSGRPSDASIMNNLAWIYQERQDPRARAMAQRAYLISPRPQMADTLGWVLATTGDIAPGLLLLKQAAAQMPGDPTVQYHLAAALKDGGQRAEALAVLQAMPAGSFAEKASADRLLQELSQP